MIGLRYNSGRQLMCLLNEMLELLMDIDERRIRTEKFLTDRSNVISVSLVLPELGHWLKLHLLLV